eukprot:COSAG05_NODE_253_length_12854_cov_23.790200_3_plen_105_part_00
MHSEISTAKKDHVVPFTRLILMELPEKFSRFLCMQCMHAGCLPGWRPEWADLPTLTRARAGSQWPVPKTDARIVFLFEFWVYMEDGLAQAHSEKIQGLISNCAA